VPQYRRAEIQDSTDPAATQPQIGQQLRFMDGADSLHGVDRHYHGTTHEEIMSVVRIKRPVAVVDWQYPLTLERDRSCRALRIQGRLMR